MLLSLSIKVFKFEFEFSLFQLRANRHVWLCWRPTNKKKNIAVTICLNLSSILCERGFSSVQGAIYALGKGHMHSIPSLRIFHNVAFKTVSMFVWMTMSLYRSFKEDHLAFPLSMPLLLVIDGVMSLVLRPQAPQHFRSSEKQATCEGCFVHQSICLVISLHSGMSKAIPPQEFLKVAVDHWHIPVWAFHFTFHFL